MLAFTLEQCSTCRGCCAQLARPCPRSESTAESTEVTRRDSSPPAPPSAEVFGLASLPSTLLSLFVGLACTLRRRRARRDPGQRAPVRHPAGPNSPPWNSRAIGPAARAPPRYTNASPPVSAFSAFFCVPAEGPRSHGWPCASRARLSTTPYSLGGHGGPIPRRVACPYQPVYGCVAADLTPAFAFSCVFDPLAGRGQSARHCGVGAHTPHGARGTDQARGGSGGTPGASEHSPGAPKGRDRFWQSREFGTRLRA